MSDNPTTPQQASVMAAMAGKFNPLMIPMMWMLGGGALSFGGMSIAIEKDEPTTEECEECEECPDIPPRRRDLVEQVETLRTANAAMLTQLTDLAATCAQ